MQTWAVCGMWLACLVAAPAPLPAAAQEAPDDPMGSASAAVLQADGRTAIATLTGIPEETLSAKKGKLRDCMIARLQGDGAVAAPDSDVISDRVLARFRQYWQASVMAPDDRNTPEQALRRDLADMLGAPVQADDDDLLAKVQSRIEAPGDYALIGRTGLLLDVMIWTRQEEVEEVVELPEGSVSTTVFYLDDFKSRGWANYLTCDRTGTGGWATSEGLFVIVSLYDSLTDEKFRVSYLAHESQHFSDYERFPDLVGWQLEYRAKLVELAYASETLTDLLRRFAENQSDTVADAHSYANRKVLLAMRERLGLEEGADLASVPTALLNEAATEELRAHSRSLSLR